MTQERRTFSRVLFHTLARFSTARGEIDVQILDLSLKGALLRPLKAWENQPGERASLAIRLDEMGTLITMHGQVAHQEGNYMGFACHEIDLDSITHLRRLMELNLGDESELQRELSALVAA